MVLESSIVGDEKDQAYLLGLPEGERSQILLLHYNQNQSSDLRAAVAVSDDGEDMEVAIEKDSVCTVCGKVDRPEKFLLCDRCDAEFHMPCLKPPLSVVPVDDWFCESCESHGVVPSMDNSSIDTGNKNVTDGRGVGVTPSSGRGVRDGKNNGTKRRKPRPSNESEGLKTSALPPDAVEVTEMPDGKCFGWSIIEPLLEHGWKMFRRRRKESGHEDSFYCPPPFASKGNVANTRCLVSTVRVEKWIELYGNSAVEIFKGRGPPITTKAEDSSSGEDGDGGGDPNERAAQQGLGDGCEFRKGTGESISRFSSSSRRGGSSASSGSGRANSDAPYDEGVGAKGGAAVHSGSGNMSGVGASGKLVEGRRHSDPWVTYESVNAAARALGQDRFYISKCLEDGIQHIIGYEFRRPGNTSTKRKASQPKQRQGGESSEEGEEKGEEESDGSTQEVHQVHIPVPSSSSSSHISGRIGGYNLSDAGVKSMDSSDEGGDGSGSESTSDGSVAAIRTLTVADVKAQRKLQDERTVRTR
jgi:hypothetical protein